MAVTEKQRIWEYMKRHGSITNWDAITRLHYTRLSDYIYRWRKNGIEIPGKRESDEKKHWTRYFLAREEAERAEREGLVCLSDS